MKKGVQTALCCPCGNEKILALGLCATCYTLKRQDAEYFGGLRELVLERDRYACRVCGDPDPGVHHREPGKSVMHLMIALCAGCHAKVHRTKVVLTEFPPLLLVLWREQHPEGHEQTYLDFNVRNPPAQSVPLNCEPAKEDGAIEAGENPTLTLVANSDGMKLESCEVGTARVGKRRPV
ncbi:HNH endonuclease, partial [Edaphobacter aggregans]|uniref:HNH endonuclease n=1 Tax=Edaphobacter aggregans TaxID=570835 RepID=UPI0007E8E4A4